MNYDFIVTSKYDKTAYQALSEASWQLFRKPRMLTQAYPVMIALVALIIITMLYNFGDYGAPVLVGAVIFIAFVLAAIPLGAVSAKARMCRAAIKDATRRGEFPAEIQFVFGKDTIHSTVGEHTAVVKYGQASGLAALGEWRFLFFGQAAYIFHTSSLGSPEEAARFSAYLTEKCGLPLTQLKGAGPQR